MNEQFSVNVLPGVFSVFSTTFVSIIECFNGADCCQIDVIRDNH
jgi:hypothetical protein